MKKIIKLTIVLVFFMNCTKSEPCKRDFLLPEDLKSGSWQMTKIVNSQNNIILNAEDEPKFYFYFLENEILKGRLKGSFGILNENELFFKAEIDTITQTSYGNYSQLDNFPQRYYDFEDIIKDGIQGKVTFYANGWNSEFSLQYEDDRIMWFKRN